ncbi:iron-containing alcohol dehydrogenase [Sulfitobacter sp.]|jgi:alcohol dehydrogenase class IV|uniref:iron-containing alcohol dehydrogenase n=1 Tax=Sulfitobacter sp. TaxID=1903071 RepID=UPI0039E6E761
MFSFFSPQAIHFGRGQSAQAPSLARAFGSNVLLVHGANARRADWLVNACTDAGMTVHTLGCQNEPSLPDIQLALAQIKGFNPDVVIALGGGAVIDFGKALAALIPCASPPQEYLEVVGTGRALDHAPLPLIALPTTAGTGAEVTKNAVITVPDHGIKVSLRDPRMIPDIAIVDAGLMQGAPRRVTLAAGLDAITQVIEPYLSIKANPMTDALCVAAIPTGLGAIRDVVENDAPAAWDDMARVSTWGGLALANAGLGAVHGFAGVIGGRTNAPHGEICGTLLPAVLASHMRKADAGTEVHSRLVWVLDQIDRQFGDGTDGTGLAHLKTWSRKMGLRGLADMGVTKADLDDIAQASAGASSMKGNPFALSQSELVGILADAL